MDLHKFINRGIAINQRLETPTILLEANIAVIAELLGMTVDEAIAHAQSNPLLEDLGAGVFRVWSGPRLDAWFSIGERDVME